MKRQCPIAARSVLAATLVFLGPPAHAIVVSGSIDAISGDGWAATGISLTASSGQHGAYALELTIDRLTLPNDHGVLSSFRLECEPIDVDESGWSCPDGRLHAAQSPVGSQDAGWSGQWHRDGRIKVEIPRLRVAGGTISATLDHQAAGWSLDIGAHRVEVAGLHGLSPKTRLPPDWSLEGYVNGRIQVAGSDAADNVQLALVADRLSYASPDGTQAGEGLVLRADLAADRAGEDWRIESVLRWPLGAVYSEPLFVDAGDAPLTIDVSAVLAPSRKRLEIDSATASIEAAFSLAGSGRLSLEPFGVQQMTLAAHSDDAGRVFELLLQPFLIGSVADDLDVQGQVGFALNIDAAGVEQAGLTLRRLAISDRLGRFGLHPSDGSIAWQREGAGGVSSLSSEGISLFAIRSGPFVAKARFVGDRLTLVEPAVIPILDGEIALDAFALSGVLVEGAGPTWSANASVRDVSLERLTRGLDWPPFGGNLAAELTDMRYAERVLEVGGGLRLAAFDGEIRVDDLRVTEPFGLAPIVTGEAVLRGLDLHALTQTFSFGRIEGRLDGDLSALQLVAWHPDRFDLHLYTPPGDKTRRRISQRAVENLTELGSGIPGGLSTSLLGIFEEFGYSAIDVKIDLRGNTASIDGLAREDGGYYLVRGSGLPRIDVIGRNRRVAWKDLVERLREIQVEEAKIE